jgi:hypothetical protein
MKRIKVPMWVWAAAAVVAVVMLMMPGRAGAVMGCPGSQVYCPGVGCLSGMDKCLPGARGGPSAVFSKEGFASPPPGVTKTCPGKLRSDGPCLMQF